MIQTVNEIYKPLFIHRSNVRYIILMGGRGAGRSTVASQYALAKLLAPEYFRCAIMRYVLGDIRNSIFREITDRAEEAKVLNSLEINDMNINYGVNSINAVGFRKSSSDQKSKLKSLANYNAVIIEEADEIPEEDFTQLDDSLRTTKGEITIVLLLNPPPKSHWIIKRFFNLKESEQPNFYIPELKPELTDTIYIRSSFEDNIKNISDQSVANYRRYQDTKPEHYWNMIKGYVPEVVRGKIYNNWQIIDSLPHEAQLVRYGLDFGYTNDPTAIVGVYKYNGGYILDEKCYKQGMSNREIADTLKTLESGLVIADSAEPKSIDEIMGYGINILAAEKGAGSVNQGIAFVKSQKISITRRSANLIKEYENYAWLEDKEGNSLNVPKDIYNHQMDAVRYAFSSIKPNQGEVAVKLQTQFTRNTYRQQEDDTH